MHIGRGVIGKHFVATSPTGEVTRGRGLRGFCELHGISHAAASKVVSGRNNKTADGWVFRYPDESEITDPDDWPIYRTGMKVDPKDMGDPDSPLIDRIKVPDDPSAEAEKLFDSDMTPEEVIRGVLDLTARASVGVMRDGNELPRGFRIEAVVAACKELAKANGIDWSKMGDRRTDAQILEDVVEKLFDNPDSIFEELDRTLDVIEENMVRIAEESEKNWQRLSASADKTESPIDGEPPGPKALAAVAHRWIKRVRRVRELAALAKNPSDPTAPQRERRIQESVHLLRYQVYVGRADIKVEHEHERVYDMHSIHVEAAMALYLSRNGYGVIPGQGLTAPGDPWGPQGRPFEGIHYAGTLILLPPRHGKTDIIIHDMGLGIDLNPTIQMAIVHDTEKEASKILRSVKSLFDTDTTQGRRNYRLYPYELAAYDNNETRLRVKTASPPKNPNVIAAGVFKSGQGNNLDRLYGDDLVPQSDLAEATTRARRITAYHGTWGSRDQGSCAFATLTGYPRHYEDLMWKTYMGAKRAAATNGREGMMFFTVRRPVGGLNTSPPFKSIWGRYPPKWLRAKFNSYEDRSLWNANYMLDPMPDEARIVQKVRLIDRESDEFLRFMATAEHHLSVDPAASNKPGQSDKAGLTIGSLGTFYEERIDEHGNMHLVQEDLLVFTQADEFYAAQRDLVERMVQIGHSRMQSQPINVAHVEITGVGHGIVDLLDGLYGINQVTTHSPTKPKPVRFKSVAGLFEHADPVNSPARVAFAATRPRDEHNEPILDEPLKVVPELERLVQYIINYNVESGFHSLDSAVQLVQYCRDHRGLAMGSRADPASFSGQAAHTKGRDPRKVAWANEAREQSERRVRHPSAIDGITPEGI